MQNEISRTNPPPFAFMNFREYGKKLNENWFEIVMIPMILYLLIAKDVSVSFQLGQTQNIAKIESPIPKVNPVKLVVPTSTTPLKEKSFNLGNWLDSRKPIAIATKSSHQHTQKIKKVPRAQHFSNLTFIMSPTYAKRKGIPKSVVDAKKQNCYNYVKKFKKAALNEQTELSLIHI